MKSEKMETFKMVCNVQTDFVHSKGDLFKVTADMVGKPIDAPIGLKATLLYNHYLEDGTVYPIEGTCSETKQNAPQNSPVHMDVDFYVDEVETPTGAVEAQESEPAVEKPKRTRKSKAKGDA